MFPSASQATSVGLPKRYGWAAGGGVPRARGRVEAVRLGPAAEEHGHAAPGVELDDHVGSFVDRPDVVFGIDPHRMRHRETVQAPSDLPHEGSRGVELEEPRGLAAPGVDEDVILRVPSDADTLSHVEVGRQLQEVQLRPERDLGRRRVGFGRRRRNVPLGFDGKRAEQSNDNTQGRQRSHHGSLQSSSDGRRSHSVPSYLLSAGTSTARTAAAQISYPLGFRCRLSSTKMSVITFPSGRSKGVATSM